MSRRAQLAASMIAVWLLAGCAAPGSTASSDSPILPLPASATSASTGPAASADPAASTAEAPTDPGLGDTRPPCASADFTPIFGPHVIKHVDSVPTVTRPFGDVGVNYGSQRAGAKILWSRLDVIVTDPQPLPDPISGLASYAAVESARPDSFGKLTDGTEPHVARVTLDTFREGPFVLPAAMLNALPKGTGTYTVYLVSGGDMSDCGFDPASSQFQGDSPIAELIP